MKEFYAQAGNAAAACLAQRLLEKHPDPVVQHCAATLAPLVDHWVQQQEDLGGSLWDPSGVDTIKVPLPDEGDLVIGWDARKVQAFVAPERHNGFRVEVRRTGYTWTAVAPMSAKAEGSKYEDSWTWTLANASDITVVEPREEVTVRPGDVICIGQRYRYVLTETVS